MLRVVLLIVAVLVVICVAGGAYLTRMPGKQSSQLKPLTSDELNMRDELRAHVQQLAGAIGVRNMRQFQNLSLARDYISKELTRLGYSVEQQPFISESREVSNIIVEIPGSSRADEIVIFGAHYDTVLTTPGANDNASGVAAILTLARMARTLMPVRTLRFILFVNEEMPYFQSDEMGSVVYAHRCRERGENIVAMFSLETIGYYSDAPNSQRYPSELAALYPKTGNFIAFASNVGSASLLRRSVEIFRNSTSLPAQGGAAPESIPGVGWSDHWSFWEQGYSAVMVTDTALYRYPHYHAPSDTPDKLDYDRLSRCVSGLFGVLRELTGAK